jgi:hypothetical protein
MAQFVISEPDIEAAVAHLRALPLATSASMPREWSRKLFLDRLSATLQANPRAKGALPIAPGVWALLQPYGIDLAGSPAINDRQLQVWVLLRSVWTDPGRVVPLAV